MFPEKETLTIEFKSDRKTIGDNVIVDEVVALANTHGGDLFIGIEDDGEVTGAQDIHRDPVRMAAMVANKTVPPVSVRAELEGDAVRVMHLSVPRSPSIVATANGRILRRRLKVDGTPECVPMYPHEITTRLSDLGRLDYSAQPVMGSSRDDFDAVERERLRRLVSSNAAGDMALVGLADDELEQALGFVARVGDVVVPTLTGLLMIGKEEAIARLVPTHEGVFQVLRGTDVKMNESYRKPLLYVIERILDLIEPWNSVTEFQEGPLSRPIPAFDRRALREAIVNAFGHRDYSKLGRVRVQIDDAGLLISSPGGFVEGLTAKNLLTAEPGGRNPRLMNALKRVGLAERTGRGIDRIYEGSLLYGRPLPDYSESTSTQVSLFIARSIPDFAFVELLSHVKEETGAPPSLGALFVLNALKGGCRRTEEELTAFSGLSWSRLRAEVELLVEKGLVEVSDAQEGRTYVLAHSSADIVEGDGRSLVDAKGAAPFDGARQGVVERDEYSAAIMELARRQGRVTSSDVEKLLHLPNANAAYYEIRKLVDAGCLTSVKQGRRSYYALLEKPL